MLLPIGEIKQFNNNTNPNTLYPWQTWQKIEGRFLLASGGGYNLGATGGEAEHILTVNEMPAHKHVQQEEAYNYVENKVFNGAYGTGGLAGNSLRIVDHAGVYTTTGAIYVSTCETGYSQSHNNMPPYQVVNVWVRTA